MKKGFSGSSSKKPRSSSSSRSSSFSSGKSFFKGSSRSSVKTDRASSQGSSVKDKIRRKKESSFVKPDNDPGEKRRDYDDGSGAGFTKPYNDPGEKYRGESYAENGSQPVQSSGGGRGCCGGITGMFSLFAILAAVVIIVFIVKCL